MNHSGLLQGFKNPRRIFVSRSVFSLQEGSSMTLDGVRSYSCTVWGRDCQLVGFMYCIGEGLPTGGFHVLYGGGAANWWVSCTV